MATALIGLLFTLIMSGVALRTNEKLRTEDRLPMQWLLPDEVVWSAPRHFALALLPALAFLSFTGLSVLSLYVQPRPGQEKLLLPSLFAIGLLFLSVQLFHLWMVERSLRRDGD